MVRLQLAQIVDRQRQLGVGAQLRPFVAGEVAIGRGGVVERIAAVESFMAGASSATRSGNAAFMRGATPFPRGRSARVRRSSSAITSASGTPRALQQHQQVVEHVGGLGAQRRVVLRRPRRSPPRSPPRRTSWRMRDALVEQRARIGALGARLGARAMISERSSRVNIEPFSERRGNACFSLCRATRVRERAGALGPFGVDGAARWRPSSRIDATARLCPPKLTKIKRRRVSRSQDFAMNDAELVARYDGRAPRYTSYPTAPHFSPAIGAQILCRLARAIARRRPAFALPACAVLRPALLLLRLQHQRRPARFVAPELRGAAGARDRSRRGVHRPARPRRARPLGRRHADEPARRSPRSADGANPRAVRGRRGRRGRDRARSDDPSQGPPRGARRDGRHPHQPRRAGPRSRGAKGDRPHRSPTSRRKPARRRRARSASTRSTSTSSTAFPCRRRPASRRPRGARSISAPTASRCSATPMCPG